MLATVPAIYRVANKCSNNNIGWKQIKYVSCAWACYHGNDITHDCTFCALLHMWLYSSLVITYPSNSCSYVLTCISTYLDRQFGLCSIGHQT